MTTNNFFNSTSSLRQATDYPMAWHNIKLRADVKRCISIIWIPANYSAALQALVFKASGQPKTQSFKSFFGTNLSNIAVTTPSRLPDAAQQRFGGVPV